MTHIDTNLQTLYKAITDFSYDQAVACHHLFRQQIEFSDEDHLYFLTVASKNPNTQISISNFQRDLRNGINFIDSQTYKTENLYRVPPRVRPSYFYFLDVPGTKGDGREARGLLRESSTGVYPNPHAHGVYCVKHESRKKPDLAKFGRIGNYVFDFQPLDYQLTDELLGYIVKGVQSTRLADLAFFEPHAINAWQPDIPTLDETREFLFNK